jgi:hypothetical protein
MGLLAGGREALDKLFPGISEELIAAGALSSDIIGESRWFIEGAYHCRFQSGLVGLLMSWPFLEDFVQRASFWTLRRGLLPLVQALRRYHLSVPLATDVHAGRGREHWDKNSLKPRLGGLRQTDATRIREPKRITFS